MQRLLLLCAVATTFGCSSIAVEYEYGGASFSGFGSRFAWAPAAEIQPEDWPPPEVHTFIHDTITRRLTGKGYTEDAAGADFLVAFRASKNFTMVRSSWDIEPAEEGAVEIFIVEPGLHDLMWKAKARAVVDQGLTPSERRERVEEGIRKMLDHFPDQGQEPQR